MHQIEIKMNSITERGKCAAKNMQKMKIMQNRRYGILGMWVVSAMLLLTLAIQNANANRDTPTNSNIDDDLQVSEFYFDLRSDFISVCILISLDFWVRFYGSFHLFIYVVSFKCGWFRNSFILFGYYHTQHTNIELKCVSFFFGRVLIYVNEWVHT